MSFPSYPAYRESGVKWLCVLPAHWSVKRFKSVFAERVDKSEHGDELLLSVSAYTGVTPRSELLEEGDHLSRSESLEGYKRCFKDDLVVNIMLAWNRGLAFTKFDGIVSPAYCVYKVVDGSDPAFLNYLVRSNEYITYFKAFSSGVIDSRLRIYPETFGALYCSLPPLEEQTAIASFLDRETAKIDALVAEQEKLITLLKEKRQAVISQAVTKGLDPTVPMKDSGVEWLGEVPAHWGIVPVKYLSSVGNGSTPNRDRRDYWDGGSYPWLSSTVVNQDLIQEAEEFVTELALRECHLPIIHPPAVLVGITGQGKTRGMASILDIEATINQHVAYVKPSSTRLSVHFLHRYFEMAYEQMRFESEGAGSTKGAITCEQVANMRLPYPPNEEQGAITAYLDRELKKLEALVVEAQTAIKLLQERRSALISAAVTGHIDVRTVVAEPA